MKYYVYQDTPDFSYSLMEKHGKFNMLCSHYHKTYEMLVILDGTRYAFFNNGIHCLTAGDIMLVKPYTLHMTENRDSVYFKRYALNFSDRLLDLLLSEKERQKLLSRVHTGIVHANEDEMKTVVQLINNMSEADKGSGTLSRKQLAANMLVLIDMLGKLPSMTQGNNKEDIICSDGLADALNYINRYFAKDITLDQIVSYAHMSKANFCRVFKKETGDTFLNYLNSLRVAYAHNLLIETDMKIQDIAVKAGFSSVLHLERVFKKVHGISPSAMRKRE